MAPKSEPNSVEENSSDIYTKLKGIIKSNGISEPISEVIIEDSGLTRENLVSKTNRVTVKFENSNVKPLKLFVKTQTDNPLHTGMVKESKLLEKEARFFMEYLPAAKQFCKEAGQEKLMKIYPKCYYGDDKIIVFEDLIYKGFSLLDKTDKQDFDAAKFALASLAKHHAISFAFITSMGGPITFFKKFPNLDFEAYSQSTIKAKVEPSMEDGIVTNVEILKKSGIPGSLDTAKALERHAGKTFSDLIFSLEVSEEEKNYLVLGHGDFWNNNMMFQRDVDTSQFIDHVMLDFQICRYNNCAIDIGNYLFTSVKPRVRRAHLHDLMKHYLYTLNITTSELGYPIDLSYDTLFLDFRRKFKFGFWKSLIVGNDPGYELCKELYSREASDTDIRESSTNLKEFTMKWLDDHPERRNEIAENLVVLMKEFNHLKID